MDGNHSRYGEKGKGYLFTLKLGLRLHQQKSECRETARGTRKECKTVLVVYAHEYGIRWGVKEKFGIRFPGGR